MNWTSLERLTLTVLPALYIISLSLYYQVDISRYWFYPYNKSTSHALYGQGPPIKEQPNVQEHDGSIVLNNETLMDGNRSWKQREVEALSGLIQKRLHFLQNPGDCNNAKKLVCTFNVTCGFGCQVHHLSFCMIMAYGTGRTLVLESKGWDYAKEGWEKFFLPLSENCLDRKGENMGKWNVPHENKKFQVVELPVVGVLPEDLKPGFLPLAVPGDIAERLERVHGKPAVWWIGEIMAYLLRPRSEMQEIIEMETAALGYEHPIVGYPGYVFVSDNKISQSANLSSRSSEESLKGIIVDLHLLARSDFLVCTFTSNICRLAYEVMQHYHVDASSKVRSVDCEYFWHGQNRNSSGKSAKMPEYEGAENIHL